VNRYDQPVRKLHILVNIIVLVIQEMRKSIIFVLAALLIYPVLASERKHTASDKEHKHIDADGADSAAVQTKKGIGLTEKNGYGSDQLQALNVSWYYNWGPVSQLQGHKLPEFIPMVFSKNSLSSKIRASTVLGFNEPDNAKQSDMTVQEALSLWPQVVSKSERTGGPAMAGNPLSGNWLPAFMKAGPKVDFVTVHWYKGVRSDKFIRDIGDICDTYKKPVWVTEFAPQTAAEGRNNPGKYTQSEVDQFIRETVAWMNASKCVERFAWHDAKSGTSALFDEHGELTETGKSYARAK
jgi:hypothetical protein